MPPSTRSILVTRQSSYNSACLSPMKECNVARYSDADASDLDKENALPYPHCSNSKQRTEKLELTFSKHDKKGARSADIGCQIPGKRVLKSSSSLQSCMKMNERDFSVPSLLMDPLVLVDSVNAWDYSDSEAAPASSWSALPNRPLPLDIGCCTCIIVKEHLPGLGGARAYSLYTNEGHGREDRKLAVACPRRRGCKSEYIITQNCKTTPCNSDEGSLGVVTSNLMGSKYYIWDQGKPADPQKTQSKRLLAAVSFVPTITTLTGRFRSMRVWIPKTQSMLLKSTNTQVHHVGGLPREWKEQMNKTDLLFSKVPYYNHVAHEQTSKVHIPGALQLNISIIQGDKFLVSTRHTINHLFKITRSEKDLNVVMLATLKRHELDFREGARGGLRVLPSVKNFQLTMEEHGKQCILLLARVETSKYVMDYRFPLTGYQAFAICLSSIDSKLCCSV